MTTFLPPILKNGKIPSSLLLSNGNLSDAFLIAQNILHSEKIESGNHPDLHLYSPDEKSELHSIASIHKLIQEMGLPPFESSYKVFIIVDAEKMLPSASNALLKTLEEPNADTFFILLSNEPNRLLPTIRSRLFPITFSSREVDSFDVAPYFSLAQQGKYNELLDLCFELDQIAPETLFKGCLEWVASQKRPPLNSKISELVAQGQMALNHNVKLKTVFLNILLKY